MESFFSAAFLFHFGYKLMVINMCTWVGGYMIGEINTCK